MNLTTLLKLVPWRTSITLLTFLTLGGIPGLSQASPTAISAGGIHTCELRSDGTLSCWGSNAFGQLNNIPTGSFTAVSAGNLHSCALKADGSLSCWGDNTFNQIDPRPTGPFKAVSAGTGLFTCAIKFDDTIACWGGTARSVLETIPSGTFTAVSPGSIHACAIKTDGSIACWGGNDNGQRDNIPTGNSFVAVGAGGTHSCALRTDGSVACWGDNGLGQLDGIPTGPFKALSVGLVHTCVLRTDGTIACWGFNANGTGQTIPPTGTYTALSGNNLHNCALKTDGTLACWGDNSGGQSPNPSINPAILPQGTVKVSYGPVKLTMSAENYIPPAPTFALTGVLPTGVSFVTDTLSGTPTAGSGNSFPLTAKVVDANGFAATRSYTLTMTAPTPTLKAVDDNYTGYTNGTKLQGFYFPVAKGVLVNDIPTGVSTRTAKLVSGPTRIAGSGTAKMWFLLNSGGSFTLTLGAPSSATSDSAIRASMRGTYRFTYTMTLNGVTTAPATVTLTVR